MSESSPDLSLKLRRRSSDSRDSFYMDFDRGIDSDIDDMTSVTANSNLPLQGASAEHKPIQIEMTLDNICTESVSNYCRPQQMATMTRPQERSEQSRLGLQNSPKLALTATLSALYGKVLVITGTAFPIAEAISGRIPSTLHEAYYLYLYVGSVLFLFYTYAMRTRRKETASAAGPSKTKEDVISDKKSDSDTSSSSSAAPHYLPTASSVALSKRQRYGSVYLRAGAVAFGMASLIYSGLEFGQYFEHERNTNCHSEQFALSHATRMTFIFLQMYFIFLNNQQMSVYRYKLAARFGLMHMIGTNLSIWLNVLVQETKHEILTQRFKGLQRHLYQCRRTNIIGSLVQDASPFLFPCTIEHSLICAAILYAMWRKLNVNDKKARKSSHHYSVDCARAHKGLFVGILFLVLTIISLILSFAVNTCELTLCCATTLAAVIGMWQVSRLKYACARGLRLDDFLLVGAQTGVYVYNVFTIVATAQKHTLLILVTAVASLLQTTCQTIFVLDASRRSCSTNEQFQKKPGREIVAFLLVGNLAMGAISTLVKSRADAQPVQLHFYGLCAWTFIRHLSVPLAIFYRFQSTVCLCEIWKRTYRMEPAHM